MAVGYWSAGSVARVTWASMAPAAIGVGVVAVCCIALAPHSASSRTATTPRSHSARTGPARLALMVVGVATTALVTAAAGPITFIAFVAPQTARRLTRSAGVTLVGSAAMGGVAGDRHLISLMVACTYRPIPVGIVTVCVGGVTSSGR